MRVSALEGHRLWAPVYGQSNNPVMALERRSMAELLGSVKPGTVADIACGNGYWLRHFQNAGSTVVGVDFCTEMLWEAAKDSGLRGRVTLGDVALLPLRSRSIDLVLCSLALGYFGGLAELFAEFARITKPGACVAVSDLHPTAISAGWTRGFSVGEEHYEIEHYRHSLEEIHDAACAADFRQIRGEVAYFGDPEYGIFESNGKEGQFAELTKIPALFLRMWRKPC
jgi:SAM-dependent methyltransferase